MIFICTLVLWSALSTSLALDMQGEIIRGYPCIKRYNQLYCPTPGNNYPRDRINTFIDDNKALIRRMYGEFHVQPVSSEEDDSNDDDYDFVRPSNPTTTTTMAGTTSLPRQVRAAYNITVGSRWKRQASKPFVTPPSSTSNRVDSCESSIEIVTPYWASNSGGKIRAVVNTDHFEQAIQQEVCQNTQTKRCSDDCSCEQKYKWHRLLAYDPDDNCKGIFMDWFLFPSCCVCKCAPLLSATSPKI